MTIVKMLVEYGPESATFVSNIRRLSELVDNCRRLQVTFDVRPRVLDVRITNVDTLPLRVTTGFETLLGSPGTSPGTWVEGGGRNPPIVGSTGEQAHMGLFCATFEWRMVILTFQGLCPSSTAAFMFHPFLALTRELTESFAMLRELLGMAL
ncbi:hypothetical protein BDM02DRAFT_3127277 [Thelephora ganbajun]|uniref:Uncharacterized protein n=1 Tax=Thelephora ganbajun TaxID=370292 RepID=A0ACB6ZNB2_THEGA|nr:hypothetical protein BDM02DRAFT_3127277 [Thelephora ganbajun]